MTLEDYADEFPPVLLWPDNERAYEIWCLVGNQWRMGMNGPVALDQMPLRHELDRRRLSDDDYADLLDSMRVMESAALAAMHA
jgi:hypothetical protein